MSNYIKIVNGKKVVSSNVVEYDEATEKIPAELIPDSILPEIFHISSTAELAGLDAKSGDIAIVTDSERYVYTGIEWYLLALDINDILDNSISSGITDKAPSQDAVHTALAGKSDTTHNHSGVYEPADSSIQSHLSNTNNPHSVDKGDVGLSNVDNTSDTNKPISTAAQSALDLKEDKSNKLSSFQTIPDDDHYATEKLVKDSLNTKADKPDTSTPNNFAALDAEGDLLDSGQSDSDMVHKSGDETITGPKEFSNTVLYKGNEITTFQDLENMLDIPVGTVVTFAGDIPPTSWTFCDGREISREGFAELFDVVGTSWGVGDGSTTFNLPPSFKEPILTGQTETDFGELEFKTVTKIIKFSNAKSYDEYTGVEWDLTAVTALDRTGRDVE